MIEEIVKWSHLHPSLPSCISHSIWMQTFSTVYLWFCKPSNCLLFDIHEPCELLIFIHSSRLSKSLICFFKFDFSHSYFCCFQTGKKVIKLSLCDAILTHSLCFTINFSLPVLRSMAEEILLSQNPAQSEMYNSRWLLSLKIHDIHVVVITTR